MSGRLAARLVALIRNRGEPQHWRGVYEGFAEVPVKGAGFAGDEWTSATVRITRHLLDLEAKDRPVPARIVHDHRLLPPMAIACGAPDRPIRIIDFGGGMGVGFIQLRRALPKGTSFSYEIVEGEEVCALGVSLFSDDRIRFHTSIPEGDADLVYINSALQYVSDYRGIIGALATARARYIVLPTLGTDSDIPTFATSQLTVPGSEIAYWFFNLHELIEVFEGHGYGLGFCAPAPWTYARGSIPATHWPRRSHDLVFSRERTLP